MLVNRKSYATLDQLRRGLKRWVRRCNSVRMHSALGCMSLVAFRRVGLSLPKSPNKSVAIPERARTRHDVQLRLSRKTVRARSRLFLSGAILQRAGPHGALRD